MTAQIERYRIRKGDDLGNPKLLNERFESIDLRLNRQETIEKDWRVSLETIATLSLERVNEVLSPAYERVVELSNVGLFFTAHSATEIEITEGLKRLTIDASERSRFAPAAYVAAFVADDFGKAIAGQVVDWDASTGELSIEVKRVSGSGFGEGWVIHAASATDSLEAAELAETAKNLAQSAASQAQSAEGIVIGARDQTLARADEVDTKHGEAITARNQAVAAKDTVLANLADYDEKFLGTKATDPTVTNTGAALQVGMQYYNSTAEEIRIFKGVGTGWVAGYLPASEGGVETVFGRSGSAIAAADGDYNATQIVFVPTGGIAANRVGAALAELDSDKADKATTLSGYGITNAYTKTEVDSALSGKAANATTLSGYGIANAYTKTEVDSAVNAKLNSADVVNNLTTNDAAKPLSAAQGKALNDKIDGLGDVQVVANLAAAAALTGLDNGDIVHVLNNGSSKWVRYQITSAGDGTWTGATKVVIWTQDQAPATHQHAIADTTGLQTALDAKAPLNSPSLTGTPLAPTAAADTNTQQLATTAYVLGQAGSAAPSMDGAAAAGSSVKFARQDHVHPSDTSRVPTTRSVTGGGLVSGGGALSADRTLTVTKSTNAQALAGTDDTTAMTPIRTKEAIDAGLAGAGGVTVLLSGVASGLPATIDFSGSLAGYKKIEMIMVDGSHNNASNRMLWQQISENGGSTFLNFNASAFTNSSGSVSGGDGLTDRLNGINGAATITDHTVVLSIYDPGSSGNKAFTSYNTCRNGGTEYFNHWAGNLVSTAPLNFLRFTWSLSPSAFDGGRYMILGYK